MMIANHTNGVEYHDKLAAEWDDRYLAGSFRRRAKLFRERLVPLVPAGGKWLDAGCGSGYFSRVLAASQNEVVGLDAAKGMIETARARATAAALDTCLRFELVKTIEILPFDDSIFDGCICLSVFEYLKHPHRCLDEIVRVLRPGGFVILSVPHSRSALRNAQYFVRRLRGMERETTLSYLNYSQFSTTPQHLRRELATRGMETLRVSGFDALIPTRLHSVLPPSLVYVIARKTGG